ncbi:solute symporter family transporter [Hortaea werneckii]|uniref:Urea active transporter n=1 Tax=Hortaea werneckii TaxID=91943 RepID=A0A3M7G4H5_HORWE|nr:solute symporter family transporter [Hortaea werneckii]KAI7566902.1 solute symporter family transporter [Hortaea werneckii]KAI7618579.1 solute symporter family transporter [Hortaea werneckii]KAI7629161.1 solute symporter family transporter [Hortaea werneckii]KAI7673927.1 solute symporter family transporter [Hortaea werneckii]
MSTSAATVLPQGAGYGVVVGVGFFFAFLMMGISWLQNRFTQFSTKSSEEFNTASRSIKPGLIASGIVSAWTWAATLLQSSTVAYQYGVAGPFWYAAGATVQILMFSILACKTKMNAPRCHTYLEIIYARYGRSAHLVFMFFAFVTNILVGSQLLLGGSAVVTSLTGMNVYAAIFLIPLGVCVYVILGGLRATFLCDYSHTLVLMVIILYFMFTAYTTSDLIGSPSRMYDLLQQAAVQRPVSGNKDGSYTTLKSDYGLIFGVIQLCSGSGTVFLDQAYWQRAIASRPTTAVRAYILGGLAWFAIPFGFSTTLGIAAVALTNNPHFPTYPNVPSSAEISSGLAAAYAASALLGQSGAVALLIVLFMAVTSCASAELIAVSSLLTFDVYKAYMKPTASPSSLIFVSHVCIGIFGLVMAVFACIWNAAGIDLGWLFLVMGLLIGGAVFPAAFSITWAGQSRAGAIAGCICGLAAGIIAWLVTAQQYFGEITVSSTGREYATLAGNLAAIMTGLIVTVTVSLFKPQNFDWSITRDINARQPKTIISEQEASGPNEAAEESKTAARLPMSTPKAVEDQGKEGTEASIELPSKEDTRTSLPTDEDVKADVDLEEHPAKLKRAFVTACVAAFVLTFIMDFLVPIPMFLSHYVFSKGFFTAWVVISFLWVFASTGISVILPIVETMGFLKKFARVLFKR